MGQGYILSFHVTLYTALVILVYNFDGIFEFSILKNIYRHVSHMYTKIIILADFANGGHLGFMVLAVTREPLVEI